MSDKIKFRSQPKPNVAMPTNCPYAIDQAFIDKMKKYPPKHPDRQRMMGAQNKS